MVEKYIIMCGGNYETYFDKPRQLEVVNGEILVERTIRLLRKHGIKDISISTNYTDFDYLKVPILKHKNTYKTEKDKVKGYWCDAFYPTDEPVCYIFGDVYFSEDAIKTIVNTDTNDIEFFASMPPFATNYPKKYEEPFALKVVNTEHLKEAIRITKEYEDDGKFNRKPIMWELWTIIKDTPINEIKHNYIPINDYTSDIDRKSDIPKLEQYILLKKGGLKMVKLKVIENFTLGRFNELKDIERIGLDTKGMLYSGDMFKCEKELADYLLGNNPKNKVVVELVEVIPEKEEPIEEPKEEKPKKKKKATK